MQADNMKKQMIVLNFHVFLVPSQKSKTFYFIFFFPSTRYIDGRTVPVFLRAHHDGDRPVPGENTVKHFPIFFLFEKEQEKGRKTIVLLSILWTLG